MTQGQEREARSAWLAILYSRAISVALACFLATILTDWAYSAAPTPQWTNASAWLLLAGLVMGVAAAMILALDRRTGGGSWLGLLVLVVGLGIEIVNFMIHMRDGYTSVVPTGLTLSLVGGAVMAIAAFITRRREIAR